MGFLGPLTGILLSVGLRILLFLLRPSTPDEVTESSRLSDLSVSTSAYGQPITIGFGTIELPGQIIWAKELREVAITTVEEISDGGLFGTGFLETTSTITRIEYRYFLDFACAFAGREAAKILKIKMNDKIVYDSANGIDIHGPGGRVRNIASHASTAALSAEFASQIPTPTWSVYLGTEDQKADPVIRDDIDGDFGTGSTPAYPGIVYIRWKNLPVVEYGNRPPRVEAEVAFASQDNYPRDDITQLSGLVDPGEWWWGYDPVNNWIFVGSEANNGEILLIDDSTMTHLRTIDSSQGFNNGGSQHGTLTADGKIVACTSTEGGSNGQAVGRIDLLTGLQDAVVGTGTAVSGDEGGNSFSANGEWGDETIKISISGIGIVGEIACHFPFQGGIGFVETRSMTFQEDTIGQANVVTGGDTATGVGAGLGVYDPIRNVLYFWQNWTASASDPDKQLLWKVSWNGAWNDEGLGDGAFTTHFDGAQAGITVEEVGRYDPSTELFAPGGVLLLPNENVMIVSIGERAAGDSAARLARIDLSDGSITVGPLTTTTYGSFKGVHKINGNVFAYPNDSGIAEIDTKDLTLIRQHDADGDIGLTVAVNSSFDGEFYYDESRHAVLVDRAGLGLPGDDPTQTRIYLGRFTGTNETLDVVVRWICNAAGIEDEFLDLSALTSDVVEGYALNRVAMNGADALESLRAAYLFDLVESDWKLTAVKRGGSSVLTIDEDYLGQLSNDPERPAVTQPRTQEVDLPREIEVWYNDRTLDYERGVQAAMRMLNPQASMDSRDVEKIDLGTLVVTPDYAKQLAEQFLYTMWNERFGFHSRLPWSYIRLDPADVFTVPYRNNTYVLRMNELEIGADMSLEFKATQERAFGYTSDAVAETETGHLTHDPAQAVPSRLLLLDAPILTAVDDTGGNGLRGYLGASGYGDSRWQGATVIKDGAPIASINSSIAWGIITTAPSTFDALRNNVFQESGEGGTLTVIMRDGGGNLSAETELDVLNGANRAAIITAGVVEVFHFRDVTSNGNQSYTLEHLLRGRRGTEDISRNTTHAEGSLLVILDDADLARFILPRSDINNEKEYRIVTFGQDVQDGLIVTHTDTGRDLRPYGPTQITATEVSGPELQIDWVRRTRFNGEWEDGTGAVPLNETLEEYTVTLYGTDSGDGSVEKTVTDTTTVNFTDAEVATAAGEAWGGGTLPANLSVDVKQSSGAPLVEGITTTEEIS